MTPKSDQESFGIEDFVRANNRVNLHVSARRKGILGSLDPAPGNARKVSPVCRRALVEKTDCSPKNTQNETVIGDSSDTPEREILHFAEPPLQPVSSVSTALLP